MIRRTFANGNCGCAAALARLDYGSRLGEIISPTLVICGSEDHGAPAENSRQMQAMIKDARFLEIKRPAIFRISSNPKSSTMPSALS